MKHSKEDNKTDSKCGTNLAKIGKKKISLETGLPRWEYLDGHRFPIVIRRRIKGSETGNTKYKNLHLYTLGV